MTRQTVIAQSRINRRRALLGSLIDQLQQGISIPTKSIKQALTAEEYLAYRSERMSIPTPRFPANYYRELKEYNVRLRAADRMFKRAERLTPRSKISLWRFHSRYELVENAYEHAFERLEELCKMYPAIVGLLDRAVFFNVGEYPSHDPVSAPRPRGSRSQYELDADGVTSDKSKALQLCCLKNSLLDIDGLNEMPRHDLSPQHLDQDIGDDIPMLEADARYPLEWDEEFDFE